MTDESTPFTRFEAMQLGVRFFKTGRPCKYGHFGKRRTDSGACEECYQSAKVGALRMRRGGNDTFKVLSEAVGKLREQKGLRAVESWSDPAKRLADLMATSADPGTVDAALRAVTELSNAQLLAALSTAPIQTDDGVLWVLTATGRALGRTLVAAMLPGDAMNMGLMERL